MSQPTGGEHPTELGGIADGSELASWDALARAAEASAERSEAALLMRELLTFEVAGTAYAVAIERVREILRMRTITPVPRVPAVVRGVITLRGQVVEVLDLRRRLGLPEREPDRRTRIVLVQGDDGRASGLVVDKVHEVLRLREDAIRREAADESTNVVALCARDDEFVSLIDLDRILDLDADG